MLSSESYFSLTRPKEPNFIFQSYAPSPMCYIVLKALSCFMLTTILCLQSLRPFYYTINSNANGASLQWSGSGHVRGTALHALGLKSLQC